MGLAIPLLLALVGGVLGYELGKAFLPHERVWTGALLAFS